MTVTILILYILDIRTTSLTIVKSVGKLGSKANTEPALEIEVGIKLKSK